MSADKMAPRVLPVDTPAVGGSIPSARTNICNQWGGTPGTVANCVQRLPSLDD